MIEPRQERRRPTVWPWVLALTVVAVLVWALSEWMNQGVADRSAPGEAAPPEVVSVARDPGAL